MYFSTKYCFSITYRVSKRISGLFINRQFKTLQGRTMEQVLVYKGLGMYEDASSILLRSLNELIDKSKYTVDYITPDQIVTGKLQNDVALLAIGGGYDLGLIKALGQSGMDNIKHFVHSGGRYLGFCSGAYFACDRIEFDKGGPLEVLGERQLKFFPGCCIGPLYKPYDYNTKSGAVASKIDFKLYNASLRPLNKGDTISKDLVTIDYNLNKCKPTSNDNSRTETLYNTSIDCTNIKPGSTDPTKNGNKSNHLEEKDDLDLQCSVYFNGGCFFVVDQDLPNVTVLSRYLDLPDQPPAIVKCTCDKGIAVLCGPHVEYNASDIDDGDTLVEHLLPELRESSHLKTLLMKSLLSQMNISVSESDSKL